MFAMASTPQFVHDCGGCMFLGRYLKYDIYLCPNCDDGSVVVRFGDEPSEYTSSPVKCALYVDNPNLSETTMVANKVAKHLLRENFFKISINKRTIKKNQKFYEDLWSARKP
jgi:hypothetical protein